MLQEIIPYLPTEWSFDNYEDKIFTLVSISLDSEEVLKLISLFNCKIKEITRIQNPYMYARYLLKQEMITNKTQGHVIEDFQFHVITESDKHIIYEYGCDPRRYRANNQINPTFETDPKNISISSSDTLVVVVKVTRPISEKEYKPYYDNDYYPQYLISFYID